MTIELKQAAQQALLALEKSQPHPSNPVIGLTKQDFIDHEETIRQLRTAIQQAEAQQPATGEPVGYMNEGHIHELAMRRLPYGYVYPEAGAGASTAVYTHPAPSVPDAAIDSAIYNQCPDFDNWHEGPSIDDIKAIVRAAMLHNP